MAVFSTTDDNYLQSCSLYNNYMCSCVCYVVVVVVVVTLICVLCLMDFHIDCIAQYFYSSCTIVRLSLSN